VIEAHTQLKNDERHGNSVLKNSILVLSPVAININFQKQVEISQTF
jgi:hypothetical protein